MNKISVFMIGFLFAVSVSASSDHKHPAPVSNPAFDQLKSLVGKWEGKTTESGKEQAVTVIYELTSGGTVLLERLMAGTPQEMVSIYHPEGKSVAMTHYCMLGNQPKMKLGKWDATSVSFEMAGKSGIQSAKEMHMHAVTIKWPKMGQMIQEWTSFNDGKKSEVAVFEFTKK